MKGLKTSVGEPAVESRWDSANSILEETKAGLESVVVEGGNAHDDVRMAVNVLSDGVHHNIGAMVEGVLDIGREEGVVHDDLDAMLVGLGDDGANVDETESRVARGLDPDKLGLRGNMCADINLDLRSESDLDTVSLGDLGEVAMGAAVDVGDRDDVRTGS